MNLWVVFQASNPIKNTGSYSIINGWKGGSQGRHISPNKTYTLESKECGTWTKKYQMIHHLVMVFNILHI